MNEKKDMNMRAYSPNGAVPFPGPPEYVEHGFPQQNNFGHASPLGIQTHGMQVGLASHPGAIISAQPQVAGYPPTAMGYPPDVQGYPPGFQGYPPGVQGYPPGVQGYPPGVQGYPPGVQGYPPGVPGYPPPVMQQPLNVQSLNNAMYMENPPSPPPGNGDPRLALDYLKTVNTLQVRQKIEIMELITSFEMENRYTIYNENGQPVLNARETSECCSRQCCGAIRPMEIVITDLFNTEVIHLHRPLNCDCCLCPCCLQNMEVTSPPGTLVSTITQNWSLWPSFDVSDAAGTPVFHIKGPFFTFGCCRDVNFDVISAVDGTEVGGISKKWTGYGIEAYTDADNFKVTFPADLDVTMKAALLGAVFLIDMVYYEQPPRNRNQNRY